MTISIMFTSLIFVIYAIYSNWQHLKAYDWQIHPKYLLLAFLFYPFGMLPTAAAWHQLMRMLGGEPSWRINLRFYSLSSLSRRIPGMIWHVASRLALYHNRQVSPMLTITATALEVVFLALTGFTIYLLTLAITSTKIHPGLRIIVLIAAALFTASILWMPSLNRISGRLLRRFHVDQIPELHRGDIVKLVGLMVSAWIGGGIILFVLTQGLTQLPLSIDYLVMTIGAWSASGAVSLTIGVLVQGAGLREVTLSALLSATMPLPIALIVSIAFRLLILIGETAWALIFTWITRCYPPTTQKGY